MLVTLYIENIAVIERAELSPAPGFNVLTGETGAGKSIILDALHAIAGGRSSRELIRTGQDRATVRALFCALSPTACRILADNGRSGKRRKNVVDQVAAVVILQSYLDSRPRSF